MAMLAGPNLAVVPTDEGLTVSGSQMPTTIAYDPKDGVSMEILDQSSFSVPCASEPEDSFNFPKGKCSQVESGETLLAEVLQPFSVTPVVTDPAASNVVATGEVSGVSANTATNVDTVVRPLFDGALTF